MRLKYDFKEMKLNNITVAVPVGENVEGFHNIIKMNDTALEIYKLLKEDTTEEQIVDTLSEEYNVDKVTLMADVKRFIQALREKGFVAE